MVTLLAAWVALGAGCVWAQNYTQVTASNITDASGARLAAGEICFLGTDNVDNAISFQVGGGGQAVRTPACAQVTNGSIALGFQVANPASTIPKGITYRITVTDSSTNQIVLKYAGVSFSGASFNLDNYAPMPAALLPPSGASVNGPLAVNGDLSVTGSSNLGQISTTNLAIQRDDNVRHADQFPGSDAGAEINACVADLPATGGVCDARGFQGAQTAAATIVLNKPVRLLLGPMTLKVAGNPGVLVASNAVHISGAGADVSLIAQAAPTANVISDTGGFTDLEVDHLRIVGVAGTVSASPNNGVDVQGATRVNVHDNQFTGLRQEAISVRNSNDVLVRANEVWGVSAGIRFIGVQHGRVTHNTIRDTQLPATTFNAPFAVDSIIGTGFQNSKDLVFDHNMVINNVNSQAFLFHDGQNVTVTGNVGDNVSNLVSIDPFSSSDVCSNFTVAGNVYNGTTTPVAQSANSGIYVNGNGPSILAEHVTIMGNTINGANMASKSDYAGGIGVNYADDVTIIGNTIGGPAANGIFLGVDATRVNIRANNISDVQPTPGTTRVGIALVPGGSATGQIEANSIDNATFGLRFDAPAPGLYVGMNATTNVTTPLLNGLYGQPPNANLSMQYSGWLGIGEAPQAPLDVAQTYSASTGAEIGARSAITLAPPAADSANAYASVNSTQTAAGNTQNFTGALGALNAEFDHFGAGTVSNAGALQGVVTNRSAGTLDNAIAQNGEVENLGSGTIANAQPFTSAIQNAGPGAINQAIAFYAPPPLNTGGGLPINTYFAFRADTPGSAVGTGYGFFAEAGLNNYFGGPVTIGGGNEISRVLQVQAPLNIGAISPGTTSDNNLTVNGASPSNACFASPDYNVEPGLVWSCAVSAANMVKLRIANVSSSSITPAAGSNWRVWVLQE